METRVFLKRAACGGPILRALAGWLVASGLLIFITACRRYEPEPLRFKPGDPVEARWTGSWYPASVLKAEDRQYKIHYTGYDSSQDEWVMPSRVRARPHAEADAGETSVPMRTTDDAGTASFGVRDRVQVLFWGQWYPATVLRLARGYFKVHYDGYGSEHDEWVKPPRIRATRTEAALHLASRPAPARPGSTRRWPQLPRPARRGGSDPTRIDGGETAPEGLVPSRPTPRHEPQAP